MLDDEINDIIRLTQQTVLRGKSFRFHSTAKALHFFLTKKERKNYRKNRHSDIPRCEIIRKFKHVNK